MKIPGKMKIANHKMAPRVSLHLFSWNGMYWLALSRASCFLSSSCSEASKSSTDTIPRVTPVLGSCWMSLRRCKPALCAHPFKEYCILLLKVVAFRSTFVYHTLIAMRICSVVTLSSDPPTAITTRLTVVTSSNVGSMKPFKSLRSDLSSSMVGIREPSGDIPAFFIARLTSAGMLWNACQACKPWDNSDLLIPPSSLSSATTKTNLTASSMLMWTADA
mmetsp:Transcript_109971/g.173255  ORF Transcript_109971/g.173255 Transcript_109971/m.173255 type:complete len:219 (-) Transcript_109971:963-1619(-)